MASPKAVILHYEILSISTLVLNILDCFVLVKYRLTEYWDLVLIFDVGMFRLNHIKSLLKKYQQRTSNSFKN